MKRCWLVNIHSSSRVGVVVEKDANGCEAEDEGGCMSSVMVGSEAAQ